MSGEAGMEKDMLERVAQAIATSLWNEGGGIRWAMTMAEAKIIARAAIEAMRNECAAICDSVEKESADDELGALYDSRCYQEGARNCARKIRETVTAALK